MTDTGVVTVGGTIVGVVTARLLDGWDDNVPDATDYVPSGRADASMGPHGRGEGAGSVLSPGGNYSAPHRRERAHGHSYEPGGGYETAPGKSYAPSQGGRPFSQGSAETDAAIVRAAREQGIDPDTMRGIASIESDLNPASNANRDTQYKGLYQIGREEWQRFGRGNIYSASDNANAAARMFAYNRDQFRKNFGRDPTDAELYMMHQQGLGFYTQGAMTNIAGNPYPGMRGPQTHESFEAGWGRELARRKGRLSNPVRATQPMPPVQGFGDEPPKKMSGLADGSFQVATLVQDPKYTTQDINELILERENEGHGTNTRKPGLEELNRTYDSPQEERAYRPYAYPPERDKVPVKHAPPTGAEKREPLPSHFYPPTPGDNKEWPKGWSIPSDYNIG